MGVRQPGGRRGAYGPARAVAVQHLVSQVPTVPAQARAASTTKWVTSVFVALVAEVGSDEAREAAATEKEEARDGNRGSLEVQGRE